MIQPSAHIMATPPDGWTHVAYDVVDSTMIAARRLVEAGAAPSLLVTALRQTQGRGRRGAVWSDGDGNLKMTAVLAVDAPSARAAELSFIAGLAVRDAVARLCPAAPCRLKWPNDILVDGAKLCGMLLEAGPSLKGRMSWALLGVGLNLTYAPAVVGAFGPMATARLADYDAAPDAVTLAFAIVDSLQGWIESWRRDGFAPILAAWRGHAAGLGGAVAVKIGAERLEGRFLDLDADGAMLLETAQGLRRVTAGDVALVQGV